MASVDLQSAITAPVSTVYAALLDLARRPDIDPTIAEITLSEDVIVAGAPFSGRGTIAGNENGFSALVTAIVPEGFLGFGFSYRNGARLHEQWRLHAVPSGTLVNYHAELTLPGGIGGKLLNRLLVGSGFRKQREAVLAHVKAAIERG